MRLTSYLFLSCALFLSSQHVSAQQETTRAENTILRVKNNNPYSNGQTRWLEKNGFNVEAYAWDSPDLNNNIHECLKRQGGGQYFALLAGASGLLAMQRFATDDEGKVGYLFLASVSTLISLNKFKKSKSQVQQIEVWRAAPSVDRVDTAYLVNSTKTEFSLKSPYKTSRNKYLIRNGFDLHSYNWEDKEVNLRLERVFSTRNAGHVMLGGSIVFAAGGTFSKLLSALAEEQRKADNASRTGDKFYMYSGGLLVSSIILTAIAKQKVRKAQRLRNTN